MELKIAKKELAAKSGGKEKIEKITLEEVLEHVECKIYYFDKDNSAKDMIKFKNALEKKGRSVYLNEVKYTLDENDYIYEMHVL